ncbi:hypothetical protein MMYC01_208258 [Madurella mycetomatis]|uniref:Uncharacterized protein n=1 Tax=Madurella mycetomatis TaxID=100816 RepID=A0A175VXW1_9PEZI|nr:hypothetical protein MMYC01_208258 [Madurella mycetomatis]
MPFDFKAYDAKCASMDPNELQREWEHYTRLISGASTSTAVSGLAIPFTLGVSAVGVGMAAPAIHNARKKREIIEKHLRTHGLTPTTRKRDVLSSMAISGTVSAVTFGVGAAGTDALATVGAEHAISAIVENQIAIDVISDIALGGAGMAVEDAYTSHEAQMDAEEAFKALGVFQVIADAKEREAGNQIQSYDSPGYGAESSGSLSRVQSPDAVPYGEMPPPPPYGDVKGPVIAASGAEFWNCSHTLSLPTTAPLSALSTRPTISNASESTTDMPASPTGATYIP